MSQSSDSAAHCLRCGSENIRPEFEQNGDRLDMVRLVCDDCGAEGKRRGE